MLNIFPEDREMVKLAFQKSVIDQVTLNIEYRLLTKFGNLKYVKVKCNTSFDKK
jgi:hypothetical protein